jgi:hypothetical protein
MKDLSTSAEGKAVAKKYKKHLREYLGRIELCEQVRESKKKQNAYKVYLDYYRKVRKEA